MEEKLGTFFITYNYIDNATFGLKNGEKLWYNVLICKLPAPIFFNSFSVNEIDKLTKQIHLGLPHSSFNGAQSVPFC
jgi:hypothetical protein